MDGLVLFCSCGANMDKIQIHPQERKDFAVRTKHHTHTTEALITLKNGIGNQRASLVFVRTVDNLAYDKETKKSFNLFHI